MSRTYAINGRLIGDGHPIFFIAEIGINHNGDIELAKKLIDVAVIAGCDAVKFQKREPELSVPDNYKDVKRETPWGVVTYLEYRKRVEFDEDSYQEIDRYCKNKGILWTASPWDMPSLEFLSCFDLPFYKVPSALITNRDFLCAVRSTGKPLVVSTGMADMTMVDSVINLLGEKNISLMHTVSTYPAKTENINLNVIKTFLSKYKCPIGYSGHEVGLQITLAAVAMGASIIERHITLDRSMWGTDQAASVESIGLIRLMRDIRIIEKAMGTREKVIVKDEKIVEQKLRKVNTLMMSSHV